MGKTLQDAIKEVAEYDGWERSIGTVISTPRWLSPDDMFSCWTDENFFNHQKYTTSADALLPVYNKLSKLMTNEDLYINWLEAGDCILKMNLPEAVIKLAGIIQQIKNK